METMLEMFRRGDMKGIWERYCGFFDLTLEQFQSTQDALLAEQLQTWQKSSLVKRVFGGTIPGSVEEFRERAPLTIYEDYAEVLLAKKESELAEPTYEWVHTSGRSGEYDFKWIPYTRRMCENVADSSASIFIVGSCRWRGDIRLKERERTIFSFALLPYLSGLVMKAIHEQFNFRIWPPYEQALKMDYFERVREAIKLSFSEGLDYFYGITSLVNNISEQFETMGKSGGNPEMRRLLRNPKVVLRLAKGFLKAKLRGGSLQPRDIWNLKGLICGGMDTGIYKERIRTMWGQYPREGYGCTELGFLAHQHWDASGMVMRDKSGYLEFLEIDEYRKWRENRAYRPRMLLLSETDAGKDYALVGTNFHGGVLVRYILGDSVTILSRSDERIGLHLPQILVSSRIDDVIDIASFTRLTERTIWTAVEGAGIPYVDWVVAKESRGENPILHLYLETKGDVHDVSRIQATIHEQLKLADQHYRNLEEMVGIKPLVVTLLSPGTFTRYLQERQAAGLDLAHSKPVHMNPKPEVVARLLSMSSLKI
jgi:hypothetical protein